MIVATKTKEMYDNLALLIQAVSEDTIGEILDLPSEKPIEEKVTYKIEIMENPGTKACLPRSIYSLSEMCYDNCVMSEPDNVKHELPKDLYTVSFYNAFAGFTLDVSCIDFIEKSTEYDAFWITTKDGLLIRVETYEI